MLAYFVLGTNLEGRDYSLRVKDEHTEAQRHRANRPNVTRLTNRRAWGLDSSFADLTVRRYRPRQSLRSRKPKVTQTPAPREGVCDGKRTGEGQVARAVLQCQTEILGLVHINIRMPFPGWE